MHVSTGVSGLMGATVATGTTVATGAQRLRAVRREGLGCGLALDGGKKIERPRSELEVTRSREADSRRGPKGLLDLHVRVQRDARRGGTA